MKKPLTLAERNREFIIKGIEGSDKIKIRLVERGFCIGEKVLILKGDSKSLIVKVNDSKYVINFGMAMKIIVDED